MKKILVVVTIAMLIPAAALAAKKKDQPQNGTDWLNAPTPDGSPTLKQTSDWLAQTLSGYGGETDGSQTTVLFGVAISNDCRFHYTEKTTASDNKHWHSGAEVSFPLGAVTSVTADTDNETGRMTGLNITTGTLELVQFNRQDWNDKSTRYATSAGLSIEHQPQPQPGQEAPQDPSKMVPRIVTALQHAVSLCQSAYKPAAETKQPF